MNFRQFLNESTGKLDFESLYKMCVDTIENEKVSGLYIADKFYSKKKDKYFIVLGGDIAVSNKSYDDDDDDYDDYEYDDSVSFVFSAKLSDSGKWKDVEFEFDKDTVAEAKSQVKSTYTDVQKA